MGDRRFQRIIQRVQRADDAAREIHGLSDEDVVSALAATSETRDPYLANVLATEAHNRLAQRERFERELEERERRIRLMVEGVRDYAIYTLTPGGRVASWNAGAERIKGYGEDEILGEHFSAFYTEADVEAGWPGRALRVAREEGRFKDERWRVRKDGTLFWANVVITALRDESGELVGFSKVTRDLTDRKRAEAALRESEERYRLAVRATRDAVWDRDLRTGETHRSLGYAEAFGYDPDAVASTAEWWKERVHPDDRERVLESEAAWRDGDGDAWEVEYRFRRADGAYARVVDRGFLVRDGDGRPVRAVGAMADVTERRRREHAKLQAILDATPAVVQMKDPEGRYLLVNQRWEALVGVPRDEAVGKVPGDLRPMEAATEALDHDRGVLEAGEAREHEHVVPTLEGPRTFLTLRFPLRDADGHIYAVCGVSTDVTERKRQEEALRASEARYATLYDSIQDAILVADLERGVNACNPAFTDLVGYTLDDLRGGTTEPLYASPEAYAAMGRAIRENHGGPAFTRTTRWRRKGGGEFSAEVRVSYLRGAGGDVEGFIGTVRDVTERERQEAALREERDRADDLARGLRAANAELKAFSYRVSHDVRAKLRAIDFFSTALAEDCADALGEDGADYARRLRGEGAALRELVDDLLRLSEADRGEVERQRVDVTALARRTITGLRERAPGRAVDAAVQEGLTADADPRLLRVVLDNLLGNAWKYTQRTPGAQVEVAGEVVDGDAAFCVRDNGAGFAPGDAPRLFEPFHRAHGDAFQGSGVGLATVRRVVEKHGGRCWAESDGPGCGATFWFTLGAGDA